MLINYMNIITMLKRHDKRLIQLLDGMLIQKSISDMFSINNTNIRDPKTIANKFCQYFSNIGPTFAAKIPNPKKLYQMNEKI